MGVGGVLAGLGIGKADKPPSVDSRQAASKVITITGNNVKDNSLFFKDFRRGELSKHFFTRRAADGRYIKVSGSEGILIGLMKGLGFIKGEDVAGVYAKLSDGFIKGEVADARYIKLSDAHFVNGDGRVVTGSKLVGDTLETLFGLDGLVRAEASTTDQGKTATVTVTNLSSQELTLASNVPAGQSGTQHGTIAPGGSLAILIGLLQPATVQIIGSPRDDAAVHTLSFTAYGEPSGQVQVVGQGIIGAG
jgi:hypothetical protein